MQRFKNILLVINPEVVCIATIHKAVSLAKTNAAKLTLISVVEQHPGLRPFLDEPSPAIIESITDVQKSRLEQHLSPIKEQGVDAEIIIRLGIAFVEIIKEVLRHHHDLVIMTAEKNNNIRSRLFGSTSMHLMRKCPCPVWVVKRAQTWPYTRILAAIDPLNPLIKENDLNLLILQLSSSMARREQGVLHIIHVWNSYGGNYGINLSLSKDEIEQDKIQHKRNFDELLSQINIEGLDLYVHFVEGEPQDIISKTVIEKNIDLLIMGTVCRTGIAGFIIGNTAEEVLNQVDCSVLTVKPKGFVTPVELE